MSNDGANGARCRMTDIRMRRHLALVMADLGLRHGTLGVVTKAGSCRMVGWEYRRRRAHDRTNGVVQLLGLGLFDHLLQHGALLSVGRRGNLGIARQRWVLVKILVVVGRRADDGAGLTRLGEVDFGVGGRKCRIGRSHDGTHLRLGGGHDGGDFGSGKFKCRVGFVRVVTVVGSQYGG